MTETEVSGEDEKDPVLSDSDWEHRTLCSDGNCIGVIGPDGLCKECGKKYEGTLPTGGFSENEETPPEEETPQETARPDEIDEPSADDDWADRKLCSDGNCIGVIGPDGLCKECGKPYE